MATDPNLLMALVNGPTLAGNAVYSGLDQGLQRRGAQQQLAIQQFQLNQAQQAAQQQQQYQTDVAGFTSDPTPQNLMNLIAKYPKQYEALQAGWKLKDQAQRTADLGFFSDVHAALSKGKVDLAAATLARRIAAEKAAGIDTSQEEQWLDRLKGGDPSAASEGRAWALGQIAAATGPDRFSEAYKTVGGDAGGFTLGPGARRFDANGTLIAEAPFAPRPVTVGEGETVVEYAPGTGGSGGNASTALATNPGAIKDGPWARSQPGYTGSSGGFATFETEAQGRAAQNRLLSQNYIAKGYDTPRKIVERYAPRGPENSDASVNNYAAYIANRLGIGVDDKIAANAVPRLAQAMGEFETGNRPGGQSGGSRVIAQGAPKQGYQVLSPQETAQLGLNPNIRYQRSPDGQIQAIGGQDTKTTKARAIPDSTAKRVEGNVNIRDSLDRAVSGFQDNYAGNVAGSLENWAQSFNSNWGTPGQRDWWSDFQAIDNQIRNDLFGAALTATEKAAYERTTISPGMDPKIVRKNLQRRAAIIKTALNRQQNFLKKNGYDAEAVDALYANPLGDSAQQQAPARPQFKIVARRPAR